MIPPARERANRRCFDCVFNAGFSDCLMVEYNPEIRDDRLTHTNEDIPCKSNFLYKEMQELIDHHNRQEGE